MTCGSIKEFKVPKVISQEIKLVQIKTNKQNRKINRKSHKTVLRMTKAGFQLLKAIL